MIEFKVSTTKTYKDKSHTDISFTMVANGSITAESDGSILKALNDMRDCLDRIESEIIKKWEQ